MNDVVELFGHPTDGTGTRWAVVVEDRRCPFMNGTCTKVRKSNPDVSIGTCSVLHGKESRPVVICPFRLVQRGIVFVDCLHLLSRHEPGNAVHIVPEITVPGGSIDYVLVSLRGGRVMDFVGVELQAVDTTGTVWPARQRFLAGVGIDAGIESGGRSRGYGLNWKMTAKTTLMQLHHKIRTFEAIDKKLVLAVQDHLLRYFYSEFQFAHVGDARQDDSMHLHAYKMKVEPDGSHVLQLESRRSTDSTGVAACLGLRADPDVGLEKIVGQLEDKLSDRTLFRVPPSVQEAATS